MLASRNLRHQFLQKFTFDALNLSNHTLPVFRLALINSPFTWSPDLVLADLDLDIPGVGIDELKPGDAFINTWGLMEEGSGQIVLPAWNHVFAFFPFDVGPPSVPCYGYALLGNEQTKLFGTQAFDPPIPLSSLLYPTDPSGGMQVFIPQPAFHLPNDVWPSR